MYTHVHNIHAYRYGFNNVLTLYTHHAHGVTMCCTRVCFGKVIPIV